MMPRFGRRGSCGGQQEFESGFGSTVLQFQQTAAKHGGKLSRVLRECVPIEFARHGQITGAMPFGRQVQRAVAHRSNITWRAPEVLSQALMITTPQSTWIASTRIQTTESRFRRGVSPATDC